MPKSLILLMALGSLTIANISNAEISWSDWEPLYESNHVMVCTMRHGARATLFQSCPLRHRQNTLQGLPLQYPFNEQGDSEVPTHNGIYSHLVVLTGTESLGNKRYKHWLKIDASAADMYTIYEFSGIICNGHLLSTITLPGLDSESTWVIDSQADKNGGDALQHYTEDPE